MSELKICACGEPTYSNKCSLCCADESCGLTQQRTWIGLTDEERNAIFEHHHTRLGGWDYGGDEVMYDKNFENAVSAIEAKLKEKNT